MFKETPGNLKKEAPKSLYENKFNCLKSKCYAYISEIDGDDNKLKGICKGYKKEIPFEQYHKCLKIKTYDKQCEQHCTKSHDHEMQLQQRTKKSLSPFDD